MGENSAYYREMNQAKRENIRQVKAQLPQHTHAFIEECLLRYQINTVYSYAHDLLIFYKYLQQNNQIMAKLEAWLKQIRAHY